VHREGVVAQGRVAHVHADRHPLLHHAVRLTQGYHPRVRGDEQFFPAATHAEMLRAEPFRAVRVPVEMPQWLLHSHRSAEPIYQPVDSGRWPALVARLARSEPQSVH